MHKKLEEIITTTKEDLLKRKEDKPLGNRAQKVNNNRKFSQAILNPKDGRIAIIAEIKLASPAEGNLGDRDNIEGRVKQYEKAKVDAISIVTEKYFFKGDPKFVKKIKSTTSLPVLQKDFIIDPYQLYEVQTIGADAVLLNARILSAKDLINLVNLAKKLGIEPVVEINNQEDLGKVIETQTKIIAVNARDLDTFKIDVDKACNLMKKIPSKFLKLGFSGVKGKKEMEKYKNAGAGGVLIGTSLMKAKNIVEYIKSLSAQQEVSNANIKAKICGIRTLEAALAAIDAGADFLGFNFVPTSKRYINPSNAKKIINLVKGKIKIVGVFQDADIKNVNDLILSLGLDFVQLHGNEDKDYINNVGISVIKSITIDDQLSKIQAKYFLLDRAKRGKGDMVDFEKAAKLSKNFPIFYAGGLNHENIAEVIERLHPFAVDVASGVETKGIQDLEKIRLFLKNAKGGM